MEPVLDNHIVIQTQLFLDPMLAHWAHIQDDRQVREAALSYNNPLRKSVGFH